MGYAKASSLSQYERVISLLKDTKYLKIASFQFSTLPDIQKNLAAIQRGIEEAAAQNVRLLLTQECALCGYPPVEVDALVHVDRSAQARALEHIKALVRENNLYLALGMISFTDSGPHNSVCLISPEGEVTHTYHKRALWGWDLDNFLPGKNPGIFSIDGIKVGIRICFEVRFPEYFRELYKEGCELCLVSFTDIGKEDQASKINIIRSHLVSRAVENVMYVLSANSLSQYQLAPSCLIDPDGQVLEEAPLNQEALIVSTIEIKPPHFGRKGRQHYSSKLIEE